MGMVREDKWDTIGIVAPFWVEAKNGDEFVVLAVDHADASTTYYMAKVGEAPQWWSEQEFMDNECKFTRVG